MCANLTTLKFDLPIDTLACIVVGLHKNESMGTGRLNRLILTISTTYSMIMVKLLDKLSNASFSCMASNCNKF